MCFYTGIDMAGFFKKKASLQLSYARAVFEAVSIWCDIYLDAKAGSDSIRGRLLFLSHLSR